jgi:hypothetical protein
LKPTVLQDKTREKNFFFFFFFLNTRTTFKQHPSSWAESAGNDNITGEMAEDDGDGIPLKSTTSILKGDNNNKTSTTLHHNRLRRVFQLVSGSTGLSAEEEDGS